MIYNSYHTGPVPMFPKKLYIKAPTNIPRS